MKNNRALPVPFEQRNSVSLARRELTPSVVWAGRVKKLRKGKGTRANSKERAGEKRDKMQIKKTPSR